MSFLKKKTLEMLYFIMYIMYNPISEEFFLLTHRIFLSVLRYLTSANSILVKHFGSLC